MEYKEAINILTEMLKKHSFKKEEKEAILTAIGTLDCGSLAKNRLKSIIRARKDKKEKDIKW